MGHSAAPFNATDPAAAVIDLGENPAIISKIGMSQT